MFSEWGQDDVVARDAAGDATASFDITKVAARTSGTELYLHFDIGSEINLQSGNENERTLRLALALPQDRELTIDFRARTATLRASEEKRVPWSELSFVSLPTYAARDYELRIDLKNLGVAVGDEVKLNFSGSDELDDRMSSGFREPTRFKAEEAPYEFRHHP